MSYTGRQRPPYDPSSEMFAGACEGDDNWWDLPTEDLGEEIGQYGMGPPGAGMPPSPREARQSPSFLRPKQKAVSGHPGLSSAMSGAVAAYKPTAFDPQPKSALAMQERRLKQSITLAELRKQLRDLTRKPPMARVSEADAAKKQREEALEALQFRLTRKTLRKAIRDVGKQRGPLPSWGI